MVPTIYHGKSSRFERADIARCDDKSPGGGNGGNISVGRRKSLGGGSSGHGKPGIVASSSGIERQYAIAKQSEHAVKHFGQNLLAPTVPQRTDFEQQFGPSHRPDKGFQRPCSFNQERTAGSAAGFIASETRSLKSHRLRRRLVTYLVEHCGIVIGQAQSPAELSQGIAHANALLGLHCTFQNLPHFRLGAAAVHRRSHAQCAMHFIGHIPNRQDRHSQTLAFAFNDSNLVFLQSRRNFGRQGFTLD